MLYIAVPVELNLSIVSWYILLHAVCCCGCGIEFKYTFNGTYYSMLYIAVATFFSTMTLPVTMSCLKRLGFKDSIISFMAPLGAQINMDGTALYQAIAPIFVATLHGMNPEATQVLALGYATTISSYEKAQSFSTKL